MTEADADWATVRVRPAGEAAVLLEVGDRIDPAVHDRVLALDRALQAARVRGVEELVPAYASLLVRFDPDETDADAVERAVALLQPADVSRRPDRHEVRVDFGPECADDLPAVADALGLTVDEVVAALTGVDLRLYLHGFAPGFAYLGGVPQSLHLPRRSTPRPPVPAGSVLLAAGQVALCPSPMPTGWWVVGRTDVTLFDAQATPPVLGAAGDIIRLVAEDGP